MPNDKSTINSTVSIKDISSNLLLDDKDITCPVCKEIFVFPRTYECGHTICELCMYEMDLRDCSNDTHTAIIHHCPICRHSTLKSWHHRPISISLESIASKHPNYRKRKREVLEERGKRTKELVYIPLGIDLADTSHTTRLQLALGLYEIIVESLYKAAMQGLSHLIIKEKSIVRDIEKVVDLLSARFFLRHNIYKIMVTRSECTIYIHKDAFSWSRQYVNRNWERPGPADEEETQEETASSRRDTQFTSVLSALLAPSSRELRSPSVPPPNIPPPPPGIHLSRR